MIASWIGVDLDGTMAYYDKWRGAGHIGAPIAPMIERVRLVLTQSDYKVKCFTARMVVAEQQSEFLQAWIPWSTAQFGQVLEATCVKDLGMIELWDDRAIQVEHNTGRLLGRSQFIR